MLAAIDEAIRKENLPVSVKRLNVVAVNNGPAD